MQHVWTFLWNKLEKGQLVNTLNFTQMVHNTIVENTRVSHLIQSPCEWLLDICQTTMHHIDEKLEKSFIIETNQDNKILFRNHKWKATADNKLTVTYRGNLTTLKWTFGWNILVKKRTWGGCRGYCSGTENASWKTPPS